MPRALRILLLPLALAACWQVGSALNDARGLPWRAGLVGLAAAAAVAVHRSARRPWTAFGALSAAGLLWLALLEAQLERSELLARGALGFAAGALASAWFLLRLTAPRAGGGPPRAGLGERLLLALAVAAGALFALEAAALGTRGLHSYDPLSSRPRHGPCLFRDERGDARANPGYRGRFVHREFGGAPVEINALGLRDGADEEQAPREGQAVVFCLGDSFAYGLGVALEDTFQELLEGLLGTPAPRVFGGGIPGFGTRDERRQLRELALVAVPDLVVLALFEDNDFQDTRSARERGPLGEPRPPGSILPAPPRPPLAEFLARVRAPAFWRERSAALQIGSVRGTGLPSLFLKEALAGDPRARVGPLVDELFEELALLAEEARGLGARLVVLLVPSSLQAEPARFERFRALLPPEEAAAIERRPFHDALAARLVAEGYQVADPLPLLEAEAAAGRSGYHVEGHWNALGHRVAARVLAPLLRDALGVD